MSNTFRLGDDVKINATGKINGFFLDTLSGKEHARVSLYQGKRYVDLIDVPIEWLEAYQPDPRDKGEICHG